MSYNFMCFKCPCLYWHPSYKTTNQFLTGWHKKEPSYIHDIQQHAPESSHLSICPSVNFKNNILCIVSRTYHPQSRARQCPPTWQRCQARRGRGSQGRWGWPHWFLHTHHAEMPHSPHPATHTTHELRAHKQPALESLTVHKQANSRKRV